MYDTTYRNNSIRNYNYLGHKKLSDEMILNFANNIATESDVTTLAVRGLGISDSVVRSCLTDNKEINMAMLGVLRKWKDSQVNDRIAYVNLCEALEKAQMNAFIHEVLDGEPI